MARFLNGPALLLSLALLPRFGNVVEMILSIAALQKGLYTVVATSLIGSILSNLLLVLGACVWEAVTGAHWRGGFRSSAGAVLCVCERICGRAGGQGHCALLNGQRLCFVVLPFDHCWGGLQGAAAAARSREWSSSRPAPPQACASCLAA